jgi:hypothetical protein
VAGRPIVLAVVLVVVGASVAGGARAQQVLLELPPGQPGIVADRREDEEAVLRVGAQLAADEGARMPFSPAVGLVLRPRGWGVRESDGRFGVQLGATLRAPTHGTAMRAAERSLTLGPAVLLEPAFTAEHHPWPGVLLAMRGFLRAEWQLARVWDSGSDDGDPRAPLLLAAGFQGGGGIGPVFLALDLSVARSVWAGGVGPAFLDVAERAPRVGLLSVVKVWTHVQLFARVMLHHGLPERRTLWTAGISGSMAAFDG